MSSNPMEPSHSLDSGRSPAPSPLNERVLTTLMRVVRGIAPELDETNGVQALVFGRYSSQLANEIHEVFGVRLTRSKRLDEVKTWEDVASIVAGLLKPPLSEAQLPKAIGDRSTGEGARKTPLPLDLEIGRSIGPYRLTKFLGEGAFASLFLGLCCKTGTTVALKFGRALGGEKTLSPFSENTNTKAPNRISPDEVPASLWQQSAGEISFSSKIAPIATVDGAIREESQFLHQVRSEILIKPLHLIEFCDRPVLVLPYVRGMTLREKIRARQSVTLNLFRDIAKDLSTFRFSHRDLKPENIMVSPSGKPVLIDPGLSLKGGGLITTSRYNPCLYRDGRADVMAIGIMLYEISTGILPFKDVPFAAAGKSTMSEVERIQRSFEMSHVETTALNAKSPKGLELIIKNCLLNPNYRMQQLCSDLDSFILKA